MIGAVVDVQFEGALPPILNALEVRKGIMILVQRAMLHIPYAQDAFDRTPQGNMKGADVPIVKTRIKRVGGSLGSLGPRE